MKIGTDVTTLAWVNNKAKKYTDTAVQNIGLGFEYQGSVATVSDLPASGNTKGDSYNVQTGGLYAWDGTAWYPVALNGLTGNIVVTEAEFKTLTTYDTNKIYFVTE